MSFMISRTRRSCEFDMNERSWRPYYRLYYLMSGHYKIFIEDRLYHVEPGDAILLVPDTIYRIMCPPGVVNESAVLDFEREYLSPLNAACGREAVDSLFRSARITVPHGGRTRVEELISFIEREETDQDGYSAFLKQNYLFELLIYLSRLPKKESEHGRLDEVEETIEAAAGYIYSHYQDGITLEEVAEMSHMSPAYFSRKFKSETGFGYKEYLTDIRIREASNLLLNTTESITEIAVKCGFGDGNYFGDAFRKVRGVSPRAFRKMGPFTCCTYIPASG